MGKNVVIYQGADVKGSNLGDNTIIGDFSRVRNSVLGPYCKIDRNNLLLNVRIGKYSYTGPFDMIFKCDIGAFCSISYGVTIGPPDHNYRLPSSHPFVYSSDYHLLSIDDLYHFDKFSKESIIGNDVWIGCNSTILRGIKVGDGAVVGANSLVNKDVPPYAIVAGCPAKIIKFRYPSDVIERLMNIRWWEWSDEKIRKNASLFRKEIYTINDIAEIL